MGMGEDRRVFWGLERGTDTFLPGSDDADEHEAAYEDAGEDEEDGCDDNSHDDGDEGVSSLTSILPFTISLSTAKRLLRPSHCTPDSLHWLVPPSSLHAVAVSIPSMLLIVASNNHKAQISDKASRRSIFPPCLVESRSYERGIPPPTLFTDPRTGSDMKPFLDSMMANVKEALTQRG